MGAVPSTPALHEERVGSRIPCPTPKPKTRTPSDTRRAILATKIRLKRMGKKFYAFYRVVITGAQYWLGVGAQPTEPVLNLLKITGDWQKFKGIDGAEGTLKTAEAGPDAQARVEAVEAQAQKLKAAKSEADAKAAAEAEAAAETTEDEAPAEEASAEEAE